MIYTPEIIIPTLFSVCFSKNRPKTGIHIRKERVGIKKAGEWNRLTSFKDMKRSRVILYHLVAWVLYILYAFVAIYREQPASIEAIYWLQGSYLLCNLVIFYYCLLLVYPRYLKSHKLVPLLIGVLLAGLIFMVLRYLLEQVLYPWLLGVQNYSDDTTLAYIISDNLFRASPMVAISAVVYSVENAFQKEKENKLLRQEKTQAELAFLKSQVNPHFLYNTLNYLYAQAYPASDQLAHAILKLSDMMRYMLHDHPNGKVALQQEVEYLRSFIDIFRLRFEDRFFVDFRVEGNLAGQRVASLVLIPFVENAFKHGVVNKASAPVKIHLHATDNTLLFAVHNFISHQQKDHSTGIGLKNIRRRLELLYPQRHQLTVQNNGKEHQAQLTLQL